MVIGFETEVAVLCTSSCGTGCSVVNTSVSKGDRSVRVLVPSATLT